MKNRARGIVRSWAVCAAALTLSLTAACGGKADDGATDEHSDHASDAPSASESPSQSASASGGADDGAAKADVELTLKEGSFEPLGKRVSVKLGEPFTVKITADAPGELHLHSTPEQHIEFDKGTTTEKITIDQPGIVELESHDTGQLLYQLEVK